MTSQEFIYPSSCILKQRKCVYYLLLKCRIVLVSKRGLALTLITTSDRKPDWKNAWKRKINSQQELDSFKCLDN